METPAGLSMEDKLSLIHLQGGGVGDQVRLHLSGEIEQAEEGFTHMTEYLREYIPKHSKRRKSGLVWSFLPSWGASL